MIEMIVGMIEVVIEEKEDKEIIEIITEIIGIEDNKIQQ